MSFDIHLAPLQLGSEAWNRSAVGGILEAHMSVAPPGRLDTSDGGADVYGEVGPDSWLMANHVDGLAAWSVIHEIAALGPYVVMPVGCPSFVSRLAHGSAVPDDHPRPVIAVADGEELRSAIVAGADGVLPRRRSAEAPASFRALLDRHQTEPGSLTASTAVLAMTSWYLLQRVEDVALDDDGDMLLFQWGTYDWGTRAGFEYNVTRQFAAEEPGELDPEIWQLSVTLRFPPSLGEGLDRGHRWCHQPEDLADFQRFVMAAPPTRALATESAQEIAVEFEPAD